MSWYAALRNFQEAPHSHLHNRIFTCFKFFGMSRNKAEAEHDSHRARDPCLFDSIPGEEDNVDLQEEHNTRADICCSATQVGCKAARTIDTNSRSSKHSQKKPYPAK